MSLPLSFTVQAYGQAAGLRVVLLKTGQGDALNARFVFEPNRVPNLKPWPTAFSDNELIIEMTASDPTRKQNT